MFTSDNSESTNTDVERKILYSFMIFLEKKNYDYRANFVSNFLKSI